jgi:hypothetical protein
MVVLSFAANKQMEMKWKICGKNRKAVHDCLSAKLAAVLTMYYVWGYKLVYY